MSEPAPELAAAVAAIELRLQTRTRINQLRAEGHGLSETARRLNAAGIPTPSGRGRWLPSTVQRVEQPERHAAYMRERRRYGRERWRQ